MEFLLSSSPSVSKTWWLPTVGLSWQWQLSEPPVDTSVDADVYDIDIFDNDVSVIADLHAQGRKVIGYINVGSWEDWRPDKDQFPSGILGKAYEGWPGEKWLDVRRMDLIAPILRARLDLCKAKGFDAVEPDNMEIHSNGSGFPITYEDQLKYALWLAEEAHQRGLAIGIKNAADQVKDLINHFDYAIVEDYFFYGWQEKMLPFIEAGKPVFAAEYDDTGVDFAAACKKAKELGFSLIQKHRILTSYRVTCP
jgi:endo-alpha-1,4-polygalactosaminidase (GH114 family)